MSGDLPGPIDGNARAQSAWKAPLPWWAVQVGCPGGHRCKAESFRRQACNKAAKDDGINLPRAKRLVIKLQQQATRLAVLWTAVAPYKATGSTNGTLKEPCIGIREETDTCDTRVEAVHACSWVKVDVGGLGLMRSKRVACRSLFRHHALGASYDEASKMRMCRWKWPGWNPIELALDGKCYETFYTISSTQSITLP